LTLTRRQTQDSEIIRRLRHLKKTVFDNPYIPVTPTERQVGFLVRDDVFEMMYGGAAGGGKSVALLTAALQYVDVPGYAAILFRRTYADLSLPHALMDMSFDWLEGTDADWNGKDKRWYFPSGATLNFGYLEHEKDKYRYQSAEFQFIGFDELSQFNESQYLYLHSRCRRPTGLNVPLRVRSASNPGGVGHEWVFDRFVSDAAEGSGRIFVPAKLTDNPHLDRETYLNSLNSLDLVTRQQLKDGDWYIRPEGNLFRRGWLEIVDDYPRGCHLHRFWDMAGTEDGGDYTVGALVGEKDGVFYIIDIVRDRLSPAGSEELVRQTAALDGRRVPITMEQEPGSSGKKVINDFARRVLIGYRFRGERPTGSKLERARPLSAAAEHGNLKIVRASWNRALIDEMVAFPQGAHDDQIDAISGAHAELSFKTNRRTVRAQSVNR